LIGKSLWEISCSRDDGRLILRFSNLHFPIQASICQDGFRSIWSACGMVRHSNFWALISRPSAPYGMDLRTDRQTGNETNGTSRKKMEHWAVSRIDVFVPWGAERERRISLSTRHVTLHVYRMLYTQLSGSSLESTILLFTRFSYPKWQTIQKPSKNRPPHPWRKIPSKMKLKTPQSWTLLKERTSLPEMRRTRRDTLQASNSMLHCLDSPWWHF
jgi:hypothetical protein